VKLSPLQQYILKEAWTSTHQRVDREAFLGYYTTVKEKPNEVLFAKIVTHSIERLIDRRLVIGHGHKTPEKWYIDAVELTPEGRRMARTIVASQPALPFKRKRSKKK